MNCITCGFSLDHTISGFVVCPNCHTVNIPNSSGQTDPQLMLPAHTRGISIDAIRKLAFLKQKRLTKRLMVIGGGITFLLALISITGVLVYQADQANALLTAAKVSITKQHYDDAASGLKKAATYYSFPSTKKQIASLQAQDKLWIADDAQYQQASALVQKTNYAAALASLGKIDKSFPGYAKVVTLSAQITAQQQAIAAAQAKATATVPVTTKAPVVRAPAPIAVNVPTVNGKRFSSTAAMSSLVAATTIAQAQQALQSFASQYGLTMEITSVSPSSYVSQYDTYTLLSDADLGSLKTYGEIFIDEWSKYPTDWVASSKLKSIVLVKTFAVSGTIRSAGPDPVGEAMYYSATYSGDYAREVLHHEFDHLITYNDFGSYAPSDPTWLSYNPPGFHYGNGGASCYLPNNTCLTGQHPISGFVTGYGASAIEEDKAELYGYLMTSDYYHQLEGWITTDPYLAIKVSDYKQFIASHSPEMSGSYFNDINP